MAGYPPRIRMTQDTKPSKGTPAKAVSAAPHTLTLIGRLVVAAAGLAAAGVAAVLIAVGIALAVALPAEGDGGAVLAFAGGGGFFFFF